MPEFVVLLSSPTVARLREGEAWIARGLPSVAGGPIELQLYTEYEDVGVTSKIPRRLLAQAAGEAGDLDEAISTFSQVANVVGTAIALAANVAVPSFELEVAYDVSQGSDEHGFIQSLRNIGDPYQVRQRLIDVDLVGVVLDRMLQSPEGERAHRACVQYQEGLGSWTPGDELRSVMHLWMAVEALTKSFLRRECQRVGVDEDGLCLSWGIHKGHLDGEARRRLIFAGDTSCYKKVKDTSNGLEHMFKGLAELHMGARECHLCAAKHVRAAILDLLDIEAAMAERLHQAQYDEPLALFGLSRNVRGVLKGPPENLAGSGHAHPHFQGTWKIKEFVAKPDDTFDMTAQDYLTLVCGSDVEFQAQGLRTEVPLRALDVEVIRGNRGQEDHQGDRETG